MARSHTQAIAEHVCAQQESILAQLQGALPKNSALRDAQAQDVTIRILGEQGRNKSVFDVTVADQRFILYIHTPTAQPYAYQASFPLQHAFQEHLRANGVPNPERLGDLFTLPDLPYRCELYEYCNGRSIPTAELSGAALQHLGETIAKAHLAGEHFRTEHAKPKFLLRQKNLPYGMVHDGLSSGNILFSEDGNVAGLVDFSTTNYRPFVADLVRITKQFATPCNDNGTLKIAISDQLKDFMGAYAQIRPLTSNEVESLSWRMARKALKLTNRFAAEEGFSVADVSKAVLQMQQELRSELQPYSLNAPETGTLRYS